MSEQDDDIIDSLPNGLRNKVLQYMIGNDKTSVEVETLPQQSTGKFLAKLFFSLIFGMIMVAIGLAIMITVIGIPIGLLFWFVGAIPLVRTLVNNQDRVLVRKSDIK